MWPILTLLLACDFGAEDLSRVTDDAALTTTVAVRQCLSGAVQLRKEGQAESASAAVLGCYRTHFEPFETPLRAYNRKATLSLEYEFGRVALQMSQAGSGNSAIDMAGRLGDRVERVLAHMPTAVSPKDTGGG